MCLRLSIFYLLELAEKKDFNYFGDMDCEMLHFRRLHCNSQHSVNCSAGRYWLSRFFPTLGLVRQQSKRVSEVMFRFYSGSLFLVHYLFLSEIYLPILFILYLIQE